MSTLTRKAWGDLTRYRACTLLAMTTLSIAIASLGFLALPALLNVAMNNQVRQSHLDDAAVSTRVLDLARAQLRGLGRLPLGEIGSGADSQNSRQSPCSWQATSGLP